MKKILLVAIVAAAGAGAYLFTQQQTLPDSDNVLQYVPADTPIFTGLLDPFPLKDYLASMPVMSEFESLQGIDQLYSEDDPRLNFFINIFKNYHAGLQNPEQLLKIFGFPEKLRAYFYTLGVLPVFKIEIQDEQAIWSLLDKNEQETGFTHIKGTLQSINYRAYPLSDENDPAKAELIVAINNGMLTLTINSAYQEPTLLATALGLTKVEHSLAKSGKIEQIIKDHGFTRASVGFINHVEILKGLTTTDGNQLARQLVALEKQFATASPLAELRNPECANDFANIANNWPNTVFGYTHLSVNAQQSDVTIATIVESKNQVILNALQGLRGYIPAYTSDIEHNVLAMGLGLDVSQLGNTLNTIWNDLQTPSFTCPALADLQAKISQSGQSIGMLSMGTAMVNSVKGVSFAILDYKINQGEELPILENLDALLTLSAEEPQQIFNSMKMFIPALQQVQLNNDTDVIDLKDLFPIPEAFNLAPKLAIKGKHLVIYNGELGKKTADALTVEPLTQNGIYNVTLDFKKMFTPIITAAALTGETIPEEAKFLMEYDSRLKMNLDVNSQGVIFASRVNSKAAK